MDGETEPSSQFIFSERRPKESPQDYWTRVMKENLNKGVPHDVVARVMGETMGKKEGREGIDDSTGLKTKTMFWHDLEEVVGITHRQTKEGISLSTSLVVLDLDNFRELNKIKGHSYGDEMLEKVAQLLKKGAKRSSDVAARFGGEEFCLILYGCKGKIAVKIAEELRSSIEKIGLTASFGVAEFSGGQESPREVFDRADTACAIAKGNIKHPSVEGKPKNRVVFWRSGMPKKPGE